MPNCLQKKERCVMASSCPKCGTTLKIYQMSPYCKKCGVHLMFASFEGQFEKDRRVAEMSMANFRYSMVKLKTAYNGGKAQKLRIAFAFIPLLAFAVIVAVPSATAVIFPFSTLTTLELELDQVSDLSVA